MADGCVCLFVCACGTMSLCMWAECPRGWGWRIDSASSGAAVILAINHMCTLEPWGGRWRPVSSWDPSGLGRSACQCLRPEAHRSAWKARGRGPSCCGGGPLYRLWPQTACRKAELVVDWRVVRVPGFWVSCPPPQGPVHVEVEELPAPSSLQLERSSQSPRDLGRD